LAVVAPPVLTRHAAQAWEELRARFPARARQAGPGEIPASVALTLNWILLALAFVAAAAKFLVVAQPAVNEAAVAQTVPMPAVEFLRRERPAGPLFNSYNWGAYLVWALPEYPVYVDGRTDLYPDEFLRRYLRTALGRDDWQAALDQAGVNVILVEAESGLAHAAGREANWREVYRDEQAVILVRSAP